MTRVLTDTNVSELLKVSAGESETLKNLIETFEKRVEERFENVKPSQDVKPNTEEQEHASSVAAG